MLAVPHPVVVLAIARLRLVAKLARTAAPYLVAVIQGPGGSLRREAVMDSCTLLKLLLPSKLGELPASASDIGSWQALWSSCPAGWAALLRLALKMAAREHGRVLTAIAAVPPFAKLLAGAAQGPMRTRTTSCAAPAASGAAPWAGSDSTGGWCISTAATRPT